MWIDGAVGESILLLGWGRARAGEFATELPPNSPERRENPDMATGSYQAVLGFPKRRGGDSNPRYRLRGTTVFETAAFNRSATSPIGAPVEDCWEQYVPGDLAERIGYCNRCGL